MGSSAAWERQTGFREEAEVCDAGMRLSRTGWLCWAVTMGAWLERNPAWAWSGVGMLLQMGVRWADEEKGWVCAERVMLESRSPASVQVRLLAR